MKLLFISHDNDCSGGAQMCLLNLIKGIKESHPDWEIYMIFPAKGSFLEACTPYLTGYKVIKIRWWLVKADEYTRFNEKLSYTYELLKRSAKLVRYMMKIKPDYGITNTIVVPHLAIACRLLNVKHCWFIHEIPAETWKDFHFVYSSRFVFRCIDKLSAKVPVTSQYAQRYYQSRLSPEKVRVVIQAVELDDTDDDGTQRLRKLPGRYTLLLVGTFDSNKGQLELLQAIKEIAEKGEDVFCYLVGNDAGCMQACRDYVEHNGLGKYVELVPYVKRVRAYYEAADVVLVCSALETFCRVAVEALQCKLPVILSNVGANPERIENGVNGLLYRKGDMADLVEKIETLRNHNVREQYVANIDLDALNLRYSTNSFASDFISQLK